MERKTTAIESLYQKLLEENEDLKKQIDKLKEDNKKISEILVYTQNMLTRSQRREYEKDIIFIDIAKKLKNLKDLK